MCSSPLLKLLLLLPVVTVVYGQGTGHGVSKSTWAVSDAGKSGAFLEKYLPVDEASGCPDQVCKCGTQGRVTLKTANGHGGFGIHTVSWAPRFLILSLVYFCRVSRGS